MDRSVLQSRAPALDPRLPLPCRVRGSGDGVLTACPRNRGKITSGGGMVRLEPPAVFCAETVLAERISNG